MRKQIGLFLGIGLFLLVQYGLDFQDLNAPSQSVMAVGLLMATWWATEAIPIPVTALLPIVLFPVLDIANLKEATTPFGHPLIYLFLGGFMIAIAMERWELHRRLALSILVKTTESPGRIVAGFMLVSSFLSMWVTNTATTMMLVPIAISVVQICFHKTEIDERTKRNFSTALLLGIAYASSVGGLGTLIGTVPNTILAGFMKSHTELNISFVDWMKVGVPLVIILVPIIWVVLLKFVFPIKDFKTNSSETELRELKNALGPMKNEEKKVAAVFLLTALAWMTRPLINKLIAPVAISDTGIAIAAGIALFMLPSSEKDKNILEWEDARKLPWSLLLMFGGGLSLAAAVKGTGLSLWLGESLGQHLSSHPLVVVAVIVGFTVFITEMTSNTATTATFLPIMAAVADGIGMDPLLLLFPTTIAASCAFMLPVATPPNGIVYGSGMVTVQDMIRAGFWLNLVAIGLVSVVGYYLILWVF